jgi:hypothetical protein
MTIPTLAHGTSVDYSHKYSDNEVPRDTIMKLMYTGILPQVLRNEVPRDTNEINVHKH